MKLNHGHKIAIIGAVAIIALVLASQILLVNVFPTYKGNFLESLYGSQDVALFADLRGVEDVSLRQKIQQCQVDLAASPFIATKANLLLASCDDSQCVWVVSSKNITKTGNYKELLPELNKRVNIEISGGEEDSATFYSAKRAKFVVSPSYNSSCSISVKEEPSEK